MKVLHVISGLTGGGAELALARLAAELGGRGVASEVVCLGPTGAAAEVLRAAGIPVHFLELKSKAGFPVGFLKMRSVLRRVRPDILHGWMYQGCLAATAASLWTRPGIPVAWSFRQTFEFPLREAPADRAAMTLCRWLSRTPAAILHNSRAGAAQHAALGFSTARARMIPNGFDTARFRPLASAEKTAARARWGLNASATVAGVAGRSHPMKDHENFIRAAALLAPRFPQARFLLAGRGLDAPGHPLRSLARDLGVEARVVLGGEQRDMEHWLGMLDVMASSSAHSEAFPNVIGEAMACGVPCAVTSVGDSAELVGDAGFAVPARDPQALAGALARLFEMSPPQRQALGARARERVIENFSLVRAADRHLEAYRAVLSRGNP